MTNVEALKTLYTALGGDSADVADITTTADMIVAISEVVPSGSSSDEG